MIAVKALLTLGAILPAAELDNNVEWSGITHVTFHDRRPLCPLNGELFAVQVRTWSNDLSSVRLWVDDGVVSAAFVNASLVGTRGPYDVWEAQAPSTVSNTLIYYFELTDGTDTDYLGTAGMSSSAPVGNEFLIDYATLSHAPLGATLHPGGGTVFRVWAPNPTSAHVRGVFNGWGLSDQMTNVGDFFTLFLPAAGADDMYKFFFSPGSVWKPDARARSLNPSDFQNSRIKDPFVYVWNDSGFQTPAFEDMIIYELHVGTFSGRNDGGTNDPSTYRDVVDLHLNHLVDLGINVVELMPVTEFSWIYSGGYNPVSSWAPEFSLGTPDDLKYMIDTLHQNGIAVVLDILWNHFSPDENYLWFYDGNQTYFDDPAVETPWGSQADFDAAEVRDYFADSSLYWLEEFHLDGYRMDATDFMNRFPQEASGWSLMQRFNDEMDARWIDKISIAEQLPDDAWVTRPTSLSGAGFDSQWHDKFTDDVRQEIFDAASGDPEMWKIRNAVLGSGTYMEGVQVVNYIESHDEAWSSSGGQRLVKTIDPSFPHDSIYAQGRTKLGHALAMFSPGIPMFLQGCEFLEDTDFGSNAPTTPEARLDWSKVTTYAGYLQFFKDMIAVRRGNGALRADAPVAVSHLNESGNVIGIHRWNTEGNDLMVVVSLSNADFTNYHIGFPQPGVWDEILNSQAAVYGGSGLGNGGSITTSPGLKDGFADSAWITVPKMSVLVFRANAGAEFCGDGTVNDPPNEECDDGNVTNGDGCDNNCTFTACGNGIVTAGEQCDDGNATNGDGCDNNCTVTGCGNGIVTAGEECDDENTASGDGCGVNCVIEFCGDNIVNDAPNEECDDGNTASGDGCDANCAIEFCGDNIVNDAPNEECDDGNTASGDGCDVNCVIEFCGDSIVNDAPNEECDDGNTIDGDGCDGNCTVTACGNGIATAGEECDDGNTINGDGCDNNCAATACGNGIVTAGEECDDGNTVSGDGCDANCAIEFCGDGIVNDAPNEECDDGNTASGDGCGANCVTEFCGDSIVNDAPNEECDDGNTASGDGCAANCVIEFCGDGIVNDAPNEECDDGNTINGDGCDENCQAEQGPCLPPTVIGNISSRYIGIQPDAGITDAVAFHVVCGDDGGNQNAGWVKLTHVDYDDGGGVLVNIGIASEADCSTADFLTPDEWTGGGANALYVTGKTVCPSFATLANGGPISKPTVTARCVDCAGPDADSVRPDDPTWVWCDSSNDGQTTFFADLFKQFQNTAAAGGPNFTGPDTGIEVDTQGNWGEVPDQQVTFFADIFACFGATAAGGGETWTGPTCP